MNLNLQKSNRQQSGQCGDDNQILFLKKCLKNWSSVKVCPLEDPDIHWSSAELNESNVHNQQQSSNQASSSDEDSDNNSPGIIRTLATMRCLRLQGQNVLE